MTIGENTSVIQSTIGAGTAMVGWKIIQAAASEGGAAAADFSTGWGFSDQSANLADLQGLFKSTGTQIQLAFYSAPFGGQDPADADTATIELIGYANNSPDSSVNPPIYIASFAGIVGTMPVEGVTDGLWFDTLVDSFKDFAGEVSVFDSGNNRTAQVLIYRAGLRYIRAYVSGALGAVPGEAPSVAMVGRVC